MGQYKKIERSIISNPDDFAIEAIFQDSESQFAINTSKLDKEGKFETTQPDINILFLQNSSRSKIVNWVTQYWTSRLSMDSYKIDKIVSLDPSNYLLDSLDGVQKNVEVAQLICYFDYLKSSDQPEEKKLGDFLFSALKKIIKKCLLNGELKYVSRKTLDPIITQNGQDVTLDKLSSGNLFLIQRLISLLGKMYSMSVLNNIPVEDSLMAKGLLIIDEAENHLHPKWQKTFLETIFSIFPNLQIVLTTHSPFIVSSVTSAKIFVAESKTDHCVLVDETDEYANKPIDEILLTPLFKTQPFNLEISALLVKRKEAIAQKNEANRKQVEQKLKELNPEYFSFFELQDLVKNTK